MSHQGGPFGEDYVQYYDLLYSDKDYEIECDRIEDIFRRFGAFPIKGVLDISCGTGGHAIPLARRSYQVTAIDSSEHMVNAAKDKARRLGVDLDIRLGDMRYFSLPGKYDACVSMFDSIEYLPNYEDLERVFLTVAKHLKRDSLFIFQFWNGVAVLNVRPSPVRKVAIGKDLKVIRFASPTLLPYEQLCEIRYHIIVVRNGKAIHEFEETHKVQFFFPQEVKYVLHKCGYDSLGIYPLLNLNERVRETDWSIVCVARFKGQSSTYFKEETHATDPASVVG